MNSTEQHASDVAHWFLRTQERSPTANPAGLTDSWAEHFLRQSGVFPTKPRLKKIAAQARAIVEVKKFASSMRPIYGAFR